MCSTEAHYGYGRFVYAIVGRVRIPRAKAVVVFGYQNYIVHARRIGVFHPAFRVYRGGAVAVYIEFAVRPFRVVKGVYSEMDKHSVLARNHGALYVVGFSRGFQRYHNLSPYFPQGGIFQADS